MSSGREGDASSSDPADTRRLVAKVREGEIQRFRELYERIAPSLYTWARIRSRPSQGISLEPEDLLQEVWLRAYENLREYDESRASFRSWIFGIAKNVAYESWRRGPTGSSADAQGSVSSSSAMDAWPAMSTSIRTRVMRNETVLRILQQLESFDPVDRMLVVHCGMEDVPSTVVATRLGMGKEAVAKRWQRLRERLREGSFAELLEL
jgi:RNA polymerase sigma factor (sigma-70 family)